MVKVGGGNYLKASNVEVGAIVTFKDEGEWVESQYKKEDGSPRMQFVMTVEYKGETKKMRINKTNSDVLVEAYGDETQNWIGKHATITIEQALVAGKKMDCIIFVVNGASMPDTGTQPIDSGTEASEEEIPF